MKNLAIFISGSGSNMKSILRAIDEGRLPNTRPSLVLSSTAKAGGLNYARERGLRTEVLSYKDKSEAEITEALLKLMREENIDYIALAGFMKVLPPAFTRAYPKRILNIHPSLIPLFCGRGYYGLRPHEAAIRAGVRESGATVHFVDEGVDTGSIILQEKCPVLEGDGPEELQKRVLEIEHGIYPRALDMVINGTR